MCWIQNFYDKPFTLNFLLNTLITLLSIFLKILRLQISYVLICAVVAIPFLIVPVFSESMFRYVKNKD